MKYCLPNQMPTSLEINEKCLHFNSFNFNSPCFGYFIQLNLYIEIVYELDMQRECIISTQPIWKIYNTNSVYPIALYRDITCIVPEIV